MMIIASRLLLLLVGPLKGVFSRGGESVDSWTLGL